MVSMHLSMASTSAESLKYDIECPICLNIFDEPKQLRCGHVICSACVSQSLKTSGISIFTCPECRTTTDVPAEGLCTNYTVKKLVAQVTKFQNEQESRANGGVDCSMCGQLFASASQLFLCLKCSPGQLELRNAFCENCSFAYGHNAHIACVSYGTHADDDYRCAAYDKIAKALEACELDTRRAAEAFKQHFEKATMTSFHTLSNQVFEPLSHPRTTDVDALTKNATRLARLIKQYCTNIIQMKGTDLETFLKRIALTAESDETRTAKQPQDGTEANESDADDVIFVPHSTVDQSSAVLSATVAGDVSQNSKLRNVTDSSLTTGIVPPSSVVVTSTAANTIYSAAPASLTHSTSSSLVPLPQPVFTISDAEHFFPTMATVNGGSGTVATKYNNNMAAKGGGAISTASLAKTVATTTAVTIAGVAGPSATRTIFSSNCLIPNVCGNFSLYGGEEYGLPGADELSPIMGAQADCLSSLSMPTFRSDFSFKRRKHQKIKSELPDGFSNYKLAYSLPKQSVTQQSTSVNKLSSSDIFPPASVYNFNNKNSSFQTGKSFQLEKNVSGSASTMNNYHDRMMFHQDVYNNCWNMQQQNRGSIHSINQSLAQMSYQYHPYYFQTAMTQQPQQHRSQPQQQILQQQQQRPQKQQQIIQQQRPLQQQQQSTSSSSSSMAMPNTNGGSCGGEGGVTQPTMMPSRDAFQLPYSMEQETGPYTVAGLNAPSSPTLSEDWNPLNV